MTPSRPSRTEQENRKSLGRPPRGQVSGQNGNIAPSVMTASGGSLHDLATTTNGTITRSYSVGGRDRPLKGPPLRSGAPPAVAQVQAAGTSKETELPVAPARTVATGSGGSVTCFVPWDYGEDEEERPQSPTANALLDEEERDIQHRVMGVPAPLSLAMVPAIVVGSHTLRGHKKLLPGCPNQDVHYSCQLGPGLVLVGVFDGHGIYGHCVANRVRDLFVERGSSFAEAFQDATERRLPIVLATAFRQIHETIAREGGLETRLSGTTATIALINSATCRVTVAHVGDSALMTCTGNQVDFITEDHVIDDAAKHRIICCGGEVRTETYSGVTSQRVFIRGQDLPGLNMARSLGDEEAHSVGVSCAPELGTINFRPGSILVVASDGVWEKLPSSAVAAHLAGAPTLASNVSTVSRERRVDALARSLVCLARAKWPAVGIGDVDDITAVVVEVAPVPSNSTS
eukprot:gnl/TRDRNA2_/TRDRNA2_127642_c1_seq1.p1 gnl/TRDRNA2_/TRDRNA2_127642_c1~~gnl/TRDRNA2_/TRDRNA2_127642_c1_seq1.p1  ORF type:complete len:521 (+),score=66.10 gnl/TRDRNA2_/TRDRNA2_127642_c1_seq1:187-1563(+)